MNGNQIESKPETVTQQEASSDRCAPPCSPSSEMECVLGRHKSGRLKILSAPPVFICNRVSIEDLINQHNALIKERDDARGQLAMGEANMEGVYDDLRAERDRYKAELQNIAAATALKWEVPHDEFAHDFLGWAQSRARHAISPENDSGHAVTTSKQQ